MKVNLRLATFLIVFVMLTGCAAYSPLKLTANEVDLRENGIVIVSVQEYSEGRFPLASTFHFSNIQTKKSGGITTARSTKRDQGDLTSFENTRGVIETYSLPPGEYEFSDWLMSNGTGMQFSPRQPRKAPFFVEAGIIKYIGNINMVLDTGENLFGFEIVTGGMPRIQDRYERDVAIAKEKYSFLHGMEIKKQIMKYE